LVHRNGCRRLAGLKHAQLLHVDSDAIAEAITTQTSFNAIHREGVIKVDCFTLKSDPFNTSEFARRTRVRIGDFETNIVSREDLIIAKLLRCRGETMNDTTPAIELRYRRLLLAKSNEERLTMATRAFDAARDLILASFPPGLTAKQVQQRLFARLYGDLGPELVPAALLDGGYGAA
jgi:hypothetical protein